MNTNVPFGLPNPNIVPYQGMPINYPMDGYGYNYANAMPYNNIDERLNNIENRLSNIEKKLNVKSNNDYSSNMHMI